MYRVYRRIEDGALVHVSSPESLEQATHLVEELYASWPGEYVVQDSQGNSVEHYVVCTSIGPECT